MRSHETSLRNTKPLEPIDWNFTRWKKDGIRAFNKGLCCNGNKKSRRFILLLPNRRTLECDHELQVPREVFGRSHCSTRDPGSPTCVIHTGGRIHNLVSTSTLNNGSLFTNRRRPSRLIRRVPWRTIWRHGSKDRTPNCSYYNWGRPLATEDLRS